MNHDELCRVITFRLLQKEISTVHCSIFCFVLKSNHCLTEYVPCFLTGIHIFRHALQGTHQFGQPVCQCRKVRLVLTVLKLFEKENIACSFFQILEMLTPLCAGNCGSAI